MNKLEFTCISCRVAFQDGETQRLHYKTDWHRYNLKRKIVDLPPVSSEEFQRRVISQQATNALIDRDTSTYCKCCRKSFSNEKAFENHTNSKKHKEYEMKYVEPEEKTDVVEEKMDTDEEEEEVDSDEWDDIDEDVDLNQCIFCKENSSDFLANLKHMSIAHTFFIPDVEYCVDLRGLIEYLLRKVNEGFMCLWCNEKGRTYHSADAAKKHMLDKGHCKMLHEGIALAEYTDFYDYSASYPDNQDGTDPNQEVDVNELEGDDYQLVLPSGAVVGHRSLMRYYKQSPNPNREVVPANKKLHKVLSTYRALGWSATQQDAAARRARDIHYMKRMRAKFNMTLGCKANKLQKHFRQQVNF